jgi:Flp pilus assembly protein TadG
MVEFALTLPLLVMMLLGIFTGGLAYNQKQTLTYATSEGARYAAAVPPNQTWSSGNWQSNVRDLVVERSQGDLSGAQVCVSLVTGTGAGTTVKSPAADYSSTGSPCIAGQAYPSLSATDNGLRVQVVATRPATIEFGLFGKINVTLTSSSTAKSTSTS